MIGRRLAHYKTLDKLAEGGMGVLYRAVDCHRRPQSESLIPTKPASLAESKATSG